MVTPVPIPNTEVKHFRGENSYACHSEGSSLPGSSVPLTGNLFFVSKGNAGRVYLADIRSKMIFIRSDPLCIQRGKDKILS